MLRSTRALALTCHIQFSSSHAQAVDALALNDRPLRERFFSKAQKLLDEERGKPSLTTMQALFLLYSYTSFAAMGKNERCRIRVTLFDYPSATVQNVTDTFTSLDRAGRIFRLSACEMYHRMRLGTQLIIRAPADDENAHRRILSQIAWASFNTER